MGIREIAREVASMQPILPVATMSGSVLHDVLGLAAAKRCRHVRLQQVVGAGRAAAEMLLRDIEDVEAGRSQQVRAAAAVTC